MNAPGDVRPHVVGKDLEAAYREMADDEVEALEWAEAAVGDVADEAR